MSNDTPTPGSDSFSDSRHGRQRSRLPVGDAFVSRLGPAGDELVAALDDPEDSHQASRPSADTPIDQLRFVALDCETTGQTPHRLVELGAVAFNLEGRIASFETLVHSTDRINPYARRLHGINPESLAGAPAAANVVQRFQPFIAGAVLVEHSADAFDTRLISATLGQEIDADNLDTSRLAAKIWDLKDTIGLERLCQQLNVHHRMPHHALADAEATADCLVGLIALGREQFQWQTLGDLLRDGKPPLRPAPEEGQNGQPRRRRRGGMPPHPPGESAS